MTATKFKIGDKVRRLYAGDYGIKKGLVYTIKEIKDDWLSVEEIEDVHYSKYPFYVDSFVLSTEGPTCKFKVGDKVIGNSLTHYGITIKGNGYGIVIKVITNDIIRVDWYGTDEYNKGPYDVEASYFDLSEPQPTTRNKFEVGDRVIKSRADGGNNEYHLGGIGEIHQADNDKHLPYYVFFDVPGTSKRSSDGYLWCDGCDLDLATVTSRPFEFEHAKTETISATADEYLRKSKEEIKMEEPKTALEKKACGLARKEVIKERTEEKQREYEREMSSFISYEKEARRNQEWSDKLRKLLGVTDNDMKELF